MKKSLIITVTMFLSMMIIFGIAFAYGTLDFKTETNETLTNNTIQKQPTFVVKESSIDNDAVNSFVTQYKTDNLTYEDHMTIESYTNFFMVHILTEDETHQINELIKSGTPMGTIWDIYEFYLTTNDDFSVISKIASYETRYYGKNWIENAYNTITSNKHGVIKQEQANDYLADYSRSEILYANVLSRKGVFTIDEILNKHKNGATWKELTESAYSFVPQGRADGSVKERMETEKYLKNVAFDYESSPYEVYEFAFFCATNGIEITDGVINGENLSEYYSKVYLQLDEAQDTTAEKMRSVGVPQRYMSSDEYFEYTSKYRAVAIDNGMSETDIQLFCDKGFSMQEIAEASHLFGSDPCAMIEHIKSKRGDVLK